MNSKSLKSIRKQNLLTQEEASRYLGISLRSYKDYENETSKKDTLKYKYLCELLEKYNYIDENHGILSLDKIKEITTNVFKKYDVNFCYLFGSYSKGKANETSDVDLLIDTKISGLDFYGLVEELRESLKKKVDLINVEQLENNIELLKEILKDGIKIFG